MKWTNWVTTDIEQWYASINTCFQFVSAIIYHQKPQLCLSSFTLNSYSHLKERGGVCLSLTKQWHRSLSLVDFPTSLFIRMRVHYCMYPWADHLVVKPPQSFLQLSRAPRKHPWPRNGGWIMLEAENVARWSWAGECLLTHHNRKVGGSLWQGCAVPVCPGSCICE